VSARLLAIITPGDEAAALGSLAGLVTIARAAEAEVRLAYFRDLRRRASIGTTAWWRTPTPR
jgi:hypothetical protein